MRSLFTRFFQLEAASGLLLIAAAVLALIINNSPLSYLYSGLLDVPVAVQVGALNIAKPLLLWINDGSWPCSSCSSALRSSARWSTATCPNLPR